MGWCVGSQQPASIGAFTVDSPVTVNMGVASSRSTALISNTAYRIWASVDCFIKFGDSNVQATTSDHPLTAKAAEPHFVRSPALYCAAIVSSGTGKLFISPMELF